MPKRIIGVDFGTSNSVVCYKDYNDGEPADLTPPILVKFEGEKHSSTPTLVFLKEDGEKSFGHEAEYLGEGMPECLIANFKMKLRGSDFVENDDDGKLLKGFFGFLFQAYKDQATPLGRNAEVTTYIGHPVMWSAKARDFTLKAAADAGFPNVKGLSEAKAALRYFLSVETSQTRMLWEKGVLSSHSPITVLLIDMGAGTTDLVLFRYTPSKPPFEIELFAHWPPEGYGTFGGKEIDQILAQHVQSRLTHIEKNILDEAFNRFLKECKNWKETRVATALRNKKTAQYPAALVSSYLRPYGKGPEEQSKLFPPLDQKTFEDLLVAYIPSFPQLVNEIMEQGSQKSLHGTAEAVDLVVLTGGHSQWYFVKELLEGRSVNGSIVHLPKIKREPYRIISLPFPQEAVARGLTLGDTLSIPPIATKNTWLKLTIGYRGRKKEQLKYVEQYDPLVVPLTAINQLLPIEQVVFQQIPYEFDTTQKKIPAKATILGGRGLAEAKEVGSYRFDLEKDWSETIAMIIMGVIPIVNLGHFVAMKGKARLFLKAVVDKEERCSVQGVLEATTSSEQPIIRPFVIPQRHLAKEEAESLLKEFERRVKNMAVGEISVHNDYKCPVTICLYHRNNLERRYGTWKIARSKKSSGLLLKGKDVRLTGEWGIQIAFENGVKSKIHLVGDVGRFEAASWIGKLFQSDKWIVVASAVYKAG